MVSKVRKNVTAEIIAMKIRTMKDGRNVCWLSSFLYSLSLFFLYKQIQ